MAKKAKSGETHVHRTPSAVCSDCNSSKAEPVVRIHLVGPDGGKRWMCKSKGHLIPRNAEIVRL